MADRDVKTGLAAVLMSRKHRDPLCARCRTRHKAHEAIAYVDSIDKAWRCLGCSALLDSYGECNTDGCCGNPTRLGFAVGEGYARVTR